MTTSKIWSLNRLGTETNQQQKYTFTSKPFIGDKDKDKDKQKTYFLPLIGNCKRCVGGTGKGDGGEGKNHLKGFFYIISNDKDVRRWLHIIANDIYVICKIWKIIWWVFILFQIPSFHIMFTIWKIIFISFQMTKVSFCHILYHLHTLQK